MGAYEFTSIAPFTLADVADALNIASGRSEATATQVTRLNVALTGTSGSCIDMDDCALIARKAAGLDPNP
jgi:hypothetical protein